jgi:hypothetical protein
LSIDELAGVLDLPAKIRVAHRLLGHEVDAAREEAFQLFGKSEIPAGVGRSGLPVGHLDEKVEIARRFERTRHRRTEEIETFDAIAPAEVKKRAKVLLNKLCHLSVPLHLS